MSQLFHIKSWKKKLYSVLFWPSTFLHVMFARRVGIKFHFRNKNQYKSQNIQEFGCLRPKQSGHWIIMCDHRDDIMKPALKKICNERKKKVKILTLKVENFCCVIVCMVWFQFLSYKSSKVNYNIINFDLTQGL